MSDICSECGNYKNLSDAREDHVENFIEWLDANDMCLRRLGDEEILDGQEVLRDHLTSLEVSDD